MLHEKLQEIDLNDLCKKYADYIELPEADRPDFIRMYCMDQTGDLYLRAFLMLEIAGIEVKKINKG